QQQPKLPVEFDQWLSASTVSLQSDLNRRRPIIFALEEGSFAVIAPVGNPWRKFRQMKYCFAFRACPAAAQPRHNFTHRKFVIHYRGKSESFIFHELFKRLRLRKRARKAIKDESATAVQTPAALAHHFPNSGVRHKIATPHVFLRGSHCRTLITFFLMACG